MKKNNQMLFPISLLAMSSLASASGFNAELSMESMYFFHNPALTQQSNSAVSFTFQPEYKKSWNFDKKILNTKLFIREDANDPDRSHTDIREFSWTHSINNFDYKVGVSKEFWGVVESHRLVDIINQIDNVEEVDNQSRLGQPMAKLSYNNMLGSFDGWVLPYFRERNFASTDSRVFSGPIEVNEDIATFHSSDKEKHIDYALRYSNAFDDIDLGVSYFQGTSRNPVLQYDVASNQLIPFYDQLKQLSTDIQWTGDALLLKLEAVIRDEASYEQSSAFVAGYEYTFFDWFNGHDIGVITEYLYDELGKSRTSFDKDVFMGVRYTMNDIEATEILAGGFIDVSDGSQALRLKVKRRINNNWKYELIAQSYNNIDNGDLYYAGIRNDDFLRFNLRYYF